MRHQHDRRRAVLRNLFVGAGAVGILVAGTAATQAFDPEFVDCFVLMIINPFAHASDCLPSQVPIEFRSLSGLQGGNVQAPVMTDYSYDYSDSYDYDS